MLPGPNGATNWPTLICLCPMSVPPSRLRAGGGIINKSRIRLCQLLRKISLRDGQLRRAIDLPHAAWNRHPAVSLQRGRELAGPEHEILSIDAGRKILPILGIQSPLRQELVGDSTKFRK